MNWKRAMAEERAALKRVVALLCALADLAERAGGSSPAVHGFVLWILLQAEAVARDLVTGALAPDPLRQAGDSRAEAMRLAAGFRELARELDRRAAQAYAICGCAGGYDRPAPSGVDEARGVRRAIICADALPVCAPDIERLVDLPDTS